MKLRIQNFIPLILSIPSVFIGAAAMVYNQVPIFIWVQNIACLAAVGFISAFVISKKCKQKKVSFYGLFILVSFLLILLTFASPGLDGVHRWVSFGMIRFNVSMIVLPVLIIALWKLSQIKPFLYTAVITIVISILLALQPDASQLTGFAIPMMIMLCKKTNHKLHRSLIVGILSFLVVLSWVFLDSLEPVIYVERIMSLVADMGLIWLILGWISLFLLPAPFILFPPRNLRLPSIYVGLYFIIILISPFLGNFPVPMMGYGISPIVGYFIAITWYTNSIIDS